MFDPQIDPNLSAGPARTWLACLMAGLYVVAVTLLALAAGLEVLA